MLFKIALLVEFHVAVVHRAREWLFLRVRSKMRVKLFDGGEDLQAEGRRVGACSEQGIYVLPLICVIVFV